MEEHKLEIADWDVGAGIFIDFYVLKSSLQKDISQSEPVRSLIAFIIFDLWKIN